MPRRQNSRNARPAKGRTLLVAGPSGLRRAVGLRPRRRVAPLRGAPKGDSLSESKGSATPQIVSQAKGFARAKAVSGMTV